MQFGSLGGEITCFDCNLESFKNVHLSMMQMSVAVGDYELAFGQETH